MDAQLADLQQRFGMALWMVVRRRGDDHILLHVHDSYYGLQQGQKLDWQHSPCSLVETQGRAQLANNADGLPPHLTGMPVGAFLSLPLMDQHQCFFGTLCALHPTAYDGDLEDHRQALLHQARLLSFMLGNALTDLSHQRITAFIDQPHRCQQTGLLDATGWQETLEEERQRCRDFGLYATVIELQGPEQAHTLTLADSLAALLREEDSIGHLGNNRFAILLAETSPERAQAVLLRIRDALNAKRLLVAVKLNTLSA